ncbi:recombinase family protein [Longirhabdus pacifica]|uniref:recombinase family protein n=1 Tax=Longirhabdus pacifica TaxID=2305227 RepID=UPI001008859A|nr:recombinase family protein [Longirhabdus pacifica]
MRIGYVRVSSKDQNEARQLKKMLLDLGIQERMIFVDKFTGEYYNRPGYEAMKRILREGDVLFVDAIDRLGRTYDGIRTEWQHITREINADVVSLENDTLFDSRKFRTMGDIGKLLEDQFLSIFAYVAEQERKKILQRQKEGIAVAKEMGIEFGRPKKNVNTLSEKQRSCLEMNFDKWKQKKMTAVEFMGMLELKKSTFYKIVKEYEKEKGEMG